jgi:hypothetical protein
MSNDPNLALQRYDCDDDNTVRSGGGSHVLYEDAIAAIKAAYLSGFRAAREAAAKVCEDLANGRAVTDEYEDGLTDGAKMCANSIHHLPDPQPGTAGDEKETK